MKTIPQILIILLLITQNLGQDAETLQNSEITFENTSENTLRNEVLETIQFITTENSLINEVLETTSEVTVEILEIKDETTTTISFSENEVYSEHDIVSEACKLNLAENEVYSEQKIVSEDQNKIDSKSEISLSENEVYPEPDIVSKDSNKLESGNEVLTEMSFKNETTNEELVSNISNKAEIEELPKILKDLQPITKNQEEIKDISEKSSETRIITSKQEEIENNSDNLTAVTNYNMTEIEKLPQILKVLQPVTNNQELKDISEKSTETLIIKSNQEDIKDNPENSTESLIEDISEKSAESLIEDPTKVISEKSAETFIIRRKQEDIEDNSENSTESLIEDPTTTVDYEVNTKPLTTLEDYALKQMNFILDNLLIETQEFIATVLQASIHAVFQRDHLKRYAEGLNRILNPDTDSEYSDEIIEETKVLTQDELYEEIILKLKFLKSKPSRYLQRHLPRDWINEYLNKREELTIWLDKACEQMHQEFNEYVSEEEDHIKYLYFNEAFDDISRATEIHQKLALLADLVKIVKNKKQITFMDLYMQT